MEMIVRQVATVGGLVRVVGRVAVPAKRRQQTVASVVRAWARVSVAAKRRQQNVASPVQIYRACRRQDLGRRG
jgi:hypothetical protein